MRPRFFLLEPGERFDSTTNSHLTKLQNDGFCDWCNKPLKEGARVVGKVVLISKGTLLGSRFSPTCLTCMNYN